MFLPPLSLLLLPLCLTPFAGQRRGPAPLLLLLLSLLPLLLLLPLLPSPPPTTGRGEAASVKGRRRGGGSVGGEKQRGGRWAFWVRWLNAQSARAASTTGKRTEGPRYTTTTTTAACARRGAASGALAPRAAKSPRGGACTHAAPRMAPAPPACTAALTGSPCFTVIQPSRVLLFILKLCARAAARAHLLNCHWHTGGALGGGGGGGGG